MTSNQVTASVAASFADTITLTPPTGLVAGLGGTLSWMTDYTLPSTVTLLIDGASSSVTVSASGSNFTVPLPKTIAAGVHTFQVIDGSNASSAPVSVLVTAPPSSNPLLINGIGGSVTVSGVPLATVVSLAESIQTGTILSLVTYPTVNLPTNCTQGTVAYASDALNFGEASGNGTGAFVTCNASGNWVANGMPVAN